MSKICLALGGPHVVDLNINPEVLDEERRKGVFGSLETMRKRFEAEAPDIMIVLSSDHLNNFFLDCIPSFAIGMADSYQLVQSRAKTDLLRIKGAPEYSSQLVNSMISKDFDITFCSEMELDHSFYVPLNFVDPEFKVPVIPIHINSMVPPYVRPERCYAFGLALAKSIAELDPSKKVAIMAAGGLSHSFGDGRMREVDEAYDRGFLKVIEEGRMKDELGTYTTASMEKAGNGTVENLEWIALAATVEGGSTEMVTYYSVPEWITGMGFLIMNPPNSR
jgi:aromatic ring-opening dioxygenase catalytic subunit (LigB family)